MSNGCRKRAVAFFDGEILPVDLDLRHEALIAKKLFEHADPLLRIVGPRTPEAKFEFPPSLLPETLEEAADEILHSLLFQVAQEPAQ